MQIRKYWHAIDLIKREVRLNIIDRQATDVLINAKDYVETYKAGKDFFCKLLIMFKLD